MPRIVQYRKPRKINVISVSVTLLFGMLIYCVYLYGPIILLEQESKRVLEQHSQRLSQHRSKYIASEKARAGLKTEMSRQFRSGGVTDPQMEVWVEVRGDASVSLGVVYSHFVPYPFDLAQPVERLVEQEVVLEIK